MGYADGRYDDDDAAISAEPSRRRCHELDGRTHSAAAFLTLLPMILGVAGAAAAAGLY